MIASLLTAFFAGAGRLFDAVAKPARTYQALVRLVRRPSRGARRHVRRVKAERRRHA